MEGRVEGGKVVADDVDGSVVCKESNRVGRQDIRKVIDEGGEKRRTKNRSLWYTGGWEPKSRERIIDSSDLRSIRQVRSKTFNILFSIKGLVPVIYAVEK